MLIRPCCSSAIFDDTNSASRATGRYSQYQWRSSILSENRGAASSGRGHVPLHQVQRAEYVPDRLAEGVGGVLHARGLLGKAAVPGIGEAHAAVVEAAHQQEREQRHRDDHDQKDRPGE